MASCCEDKGCEVTALRESHGRVLWAVLIINAVMFFVEAYSGIVAHSTSLLADSLDMLGDAIVYGFSLFVLAKSLRWQALAAVPKAELMGTIGALALFANLICFGLLYRHRSDNLNMSSTWLCSRNDLIANVGVLIAAGASYWLTSRWPDIAVGTLIAGLFLHSSISVLKDALKELRRPSPVPVKQPQAVAVGVGMPVRRNKKAAPVHR